MSNQTGKDAPLDCTERILSARSDDGESEAEVRRDPERDAVANGRLQCCDCGSKRNEERNFAGEWRGDDRGDARPAADACGHAAEIFGRGDTRDLVAYLETLR